MIVAFAKRKDERAKMETWNLGILSSETASSAERRAVSVDKWKLCNPRGRSNP